MKVCFIVPGKFPSYGGLENLVYSLAEHLSCRGVKVYIYALSPGFSRPPPEGATVYALHPKPVHLIPFLQWFVQVVKVNLAILSLVRREGVQVIHCHQCFPSVLYGLLAKLVGRRVLICTSHGVDIQVDAAAGYGVRRSRVLALALRLLLRFFVDAHVVVSMSMIKDAVDAGSLPKNIFVIYNGIDFVSIPDVSEVTLNDYLKRLGIRADDFVILYLGRLHPKKQPDILVKAMPRVLEKIPNAKLVMAGGGDVYYAVKLRKLAEMLGVGDRVIFTGFVPEDVKWMLMRRCDVFVLPSRTEAFGIALVEAMGCGKPVIATRGGPFPEIVVDGVTGILVPKDSPNSIANAIVTLFSDAEGRIKMGEAAKRRAREEFCIERAVERHIELYRLLLIARTRARETRECGRGA